MEVRRPVPMALGLLTILLYSFCGCTDGGIVSVIQLAAATTTIVSQSWQYIANAKKAKIGDLAAKLQYLEDQILDVDRFVMNTDSMVYGIVSRLNRDTRLELQLNELGMLVHQISSAKKRLDTYMTSSEPAEQLTIEDFARWCVSQGFNSVSSMLERISMLTTPVSEQSLVNPGVHAILLNSIEKSDNYLCEMQQSPHQLLYNMYNTILLTEIKGYTMMQFSWMFLKIYGLGNFTTETKEAKKRYEERINMTIASCKNIVRQANRYVRRCEPDRHIEGETFVALTRLLQGYVENEVDMNVDAACRHNCAYYQLAKNQRCYKEQFCAKQKPCMGKIIDCKFVESDMTICQSGKNSPRRYDWIKYETGKMHGKYKHCSRSSSKVESWWRWLFWHCSYCMCICDQIGPESDRYFSLKEESSNVEMNKVITGIRFTKVNRVIYLQLSEGTLLPGGKIDPESIAWKKIQPMDLKYSNKNVDYHELAYEKRAIDLDDLEGPRGNVLTGVRFKVLGGNLNLEIRTTPFNFDTGELQKEKYLWISNDMTTESYFTPRKELKLKNPGVPTEARTHALPDSAQNQYVKFTHSDMSKDAAQTTVPYLDAQPVISKIPVPLSGAGLFHRGSPGDGGFVAPRISTFDYSYYMDGFVATIFEETDFLEGSGVTESDLEKELPNSVK